MEKFKGRNNHKLQTTETSRMEMHKHSHAVTHKKRLGEYLPEFLLLFLAVFLGFIAENQREHMIEHRREKQYARLLFTDLNKDSAFFSSRGAIIGSTID